jgi:hypothetical protein
MALRRWSILEGFFGSIYGTIAGMSAGAAACSMATDRGFVPPVHEVLWFLVPGLVTGGVVGLVLGGYGDWFCKRQKTALAASDQTDVPSAR